MERVQPGAVWEFYGSTEAQFTVCGPDEWLAHPGIGGSGPAGTPPVHRPAGTDEGPTAGDAASGDAALDDAAGDGAGTIWCDMPPFARFSLLG